MGELWWLILFILPHDENHVCPNKASLCQGAFLCGPDNNLGRSHNHTINELTSANKDASVHHKIKK